MKKYYFEPVGRCLVYGFITLFFVAILVLAIAAKDTTSPQSTAIVIGMCCVYIPPVLFWFCYSLTMRIQIDYDKKELYFRHYLFIKRIKFEDVLSIEITYCEETVFDFVVTTKTWTRKMAYARYARKKATKKITAKLNELKQDLMNISNKNY